MRNRSYIGFLGPDDILGGPESRAQVEHDGVVVRRCVARGQLPGMCAPADGGARGYAPQQPDARPGGAGAGAVKKVGTRASWGPGGASGVPLLLLACGRPSAMRAIRINKNISDI